MRPPGIDKITEKAQVSQDGTMVAVPRSESQAGASDTESNSERDGEVTASLPLDSHLPVRLPLVAGERE